MSGAIVSRRQLPSCRGPGKCRKQKLTTGCPHVWGPLSAVSSTAVVAASHRRVGIFGAFEQEYDQDARGRTLFKGAIGLDFNMT